MAKSRKKTISYRRAEWLKVDSQKRTLEDFIAAAHAIYKTVKCRKFQRPDGQIVKCASYNPLDAGGAFLHLVAETPGDEASTLSAEDEEKEASEVGVAPPPTGKEFMDGDIFVYVVGNNVCLCSTVLRDAVLTLYLQSVFQKAKLGEVATMFELQKVANIDKLKVIQAEGVKEIDIKASLYDASLHCETRNATTMRALGVAAKHIKAVFGSNPKASPDNLQVGITIVADGRMKGRILGDDHIKKLAKEVVEGDDDYVIVTKKNQRISKDEIYVRDKVDIAKHGKSIKRDAAWEALSNFYTGLLTSGVVAQ